MTTQRTPGPWLVNGNVNRSGAVRRTVEDTTDLLTAALASLNNGNPGPYVARERIEAALNKLRVLAFLQPLTDEQIDNMVATASLAERDMFRRFAHAIERAHGIGGET